MTTNKFYTYGNFDTEEAAHVFFESIIPGNLFKTYKEVRGFYNNAPKHLLRIDFILSPRDKLVNAGWDCGIIGIECKNSGHDIGPPITQMLNYKNTTWVLPPANFQIYLDFIFLFPMQPITGQLASVMCQNRIGVCCQNIDKWTKETFVLQSADGRRILTVYKDGKFKFQTSNQGLKIGSR